MLQFVHVVRHAVNFYVGSVKFWSSFVVFRVAENVFDLVNFLSYFKFRSDLGFVYCIGRACLLSCAVCCASCRIKDNYLARISAFCDDLVCAGNNFGSDVSTGNRMLTPYSSWNGLTPLLGMTAAL